MNFCSSCGQPVTVGSQYCSGCGAQVAGFDNTRSQAGTGGGPVIGAATPPEPTHAVPPPTPPVAPDEVTDMSTKAPMRKALILAGSALLIVAIVVGGVVALNVMRVGVAPGPAASNTARRPAPPEGRIQLTLAPFASANELITNETITESIRILRQRLDSTGLSGATITRQGSNNIVVVMPGNPDRAIIAMLQKEGQMRFRAVLVEGAAVPVASPARTATTGAPPAPGGGPKDASDLAWVTLNLDAAYKALDCASFKDVEAIVDDPAKPMVTCSSDGHTKYILGPAEVLGSMISNATSGQQQTQSGSIGIWEIRLDFNPAGTKSFCDVTSRIVSLPAPRNQFAVVLDKQVMSAPATQAALCGGKASITGSFTAASSKILADQLKFGALPLSFRLMRSDQISATLGSS